MKINLNRKHYQQSLNLKPRTDNVRLKKRKKMFYIKSQIQKNPSVSRNKGMGNNVETDKVIGDCFSLVRR